jgi:hypothetical protein
MKYTKHTNTLSGQKGKDCELQLATSYVKKGKGNPVTGPGGPIG